MNRSQAVVALPMRRTLSPSRRKITLSLKGGALASSSRLIEKGGRSLAKKRGHRSRLKNQAIVAVQKTTIATVKERGGMSNPKHAGNGTPLGHYPGSGRWVNAREWILA